MKSSHRSLLRAVALLGCASLAACTASIDQASFFPQSMEAPHSVLKPPPGYALTHMLLDLPGLGKLHAARLDHAANNATIIYSGGNGSFVAGGTDIAAALAEATGADLIFYDYPGRGGTTVPPTIDASIATGPAMLQALRRAGWIGGGPLFAYGLSFGGSQAAAMTREGGFDGLIIEASAADLASVGRNFVPGIARPFVKVEVDPELRRFDYLGYATAHRTPILLIASRDDDIVRERNMADFADQLRMRGSDVTLITVPGEHGTGLGQPVALTALRSFVEKRSRMPAAASN